MRDSGRKVLILGGYGAFGSRLARLLAGEPRLTLVIAGRSLARAEAFCGSLDARATLVPVELDRAGDVAAALRLLAPDIVVDASGPFQDYGEGRYRLVEVCLALGIDYLDLADGSAFVRGIARFDAAAKERGIYILSGASSFPTLTAAVVQELGAGLARVEDVTVGVAPSPFADVGENVVRAIASYAGKPVELWRDGKPARGAALIEARRATIAVPGALPLANRRFALVDVPDLTLLAERLSGLRSVWVGASTLPVSLHYGLSALAVMVRLRLMPSLSPLAGLFHRAMRVLRWGEPRGGMFVALAGTGPEGSVERSWHLIAEDDHGPMIPAMAVAIIIRRDLAGDRPEAGARPASGTVSLAEYEAEFVRHGIVTGRWETGAGAPRLPLYRRILGEAFQTLPEPIRAMHELDGSLTATGRADVERGAGLLARLVAAAIGFPAAGKNVPVTVSFSARDGVERWERSFDGRRFVSTQEAGRGRSERLIVERFGPIAVAFALVVEGERLRLVLRRWSLFGIPLPLALAPGGAAFEEAEDGRFRFDVEIGHPWIGLIVRYRGWLVPAREATPA